MNGLDMYVQAQTSDPGLNKMFDDFDRQLGKIDKQIKENDQIFKEKAQKFNGLMDDCLAAGNTHDDCSKDFLDCQSYQFTVRECLYHQEYTNKPTPDSIHQSIIQKLDGYNEHIKQQTQLCENMGFCSTN
jgi:hypothetical protein